MPKFMVVKRFFALAACLFFAASLTAQQDADGGELANEKVRRGLRTLSNQIAEFATQQELDQYASILIQLGDTQDLHQPLRSGWESRLKNTKPELRPQRAARAAKALRKHVRALEKELGNLSDKRRERLATIILELDSQSAAANKVLGHKKVAGRWQSTQRLAWAEGASHVAKLMSDAWQLKVPISASASNNQAARNLYGLDAVMVSSHGIRLHGGMSSEKMERILHECLRAMAFSNAVRGGDLNIPVVKPEQELLLTHDLYTFEKVVAEAVENGGLNEAQGSEVLRMDLQSYTDGRGWRTSNWQSEADFQALILWDTYEGWLAKDVQPCLLAGHLHWLCLNFYGTSISQVMWSQRSAVLNASVGAQQAPKDDLWKSVGTSFFGCRSWMKERMKGGDVFPYSGAIVPELGQVRDESLLKATLVNDYLQQVAKLGPIMEATANKPRKISTMSSALGMNLAKFEQIWANWLMADQQRSGLIQRWSGDDVAAQEEGHSEEALAALAYVRNLRRQAYEARNIWVEEVNLNAELSRQAELHARYLDSNSNQANKWPDVHEEYFGRKGFTPEGAWAGRQSLIHGKDDPKAVIDEWMGTFYHRMPILHPGMFGLGYGQSNKFAVMDTNSLTAPYHGEIWSVWPADGSRGVGRRFIPEMPSPVPGENPNKWGYPITLHAFFGQTRRTANIKMTLHFGESKTGKEVDCYFVTPDNNPHPRFSPENAYALIPKSALKGNQEYTVVAECKELSKEMAWTFTTGSQ